MPRGSKNFWRIEPRQVIDFFTEEWGLKLLALVLAFLLWTVVQAEEPARAPIGNIEVTVFETDPEWVWVGRPDPPTVEAVISGPSRELLQVAVTRPRIVIPIDEVQDSVVRVPLEVPWIHFPAQTDNILIESLRPSTVELRFERVQTISVPIALPLTGSPVPGFEQQGPVTIEPAAVTLSGPRSRLAGLDTLLLLPPLDLSGRSATDTQVVAVDPPAQGVTVYPPQVRVIIPIGPIGDSAAVRRRPPATSGGGG